MSKNLFGFSLKAPTDSFFGPKNFSPKNSFSSLPVKKPNNLNSNLARIFNEEQEESDREKGEREVMHTGKVEEGATSTEPKFGKVQLNAGRDRTKEKEMQSYMEKDSSIFQYDEIYDDIVSNKKIKQSNNAANKFTYLGFMKNKAKHDEKLIDQKDEEEKRSIGRDARQETTGKSNYVHKLIASNQKRTLEREIIQEKILQKERDKDIAIYGDKESFITSSYKKKLALRKIIQEELSRQDENDKKNDVTKKENFADFHKNLLARGLSTRSNCVANVGNLSKESSESKKLREESSESKKLREESSESKKLREESSESKKLREESSESQKLSKESSESKKLREESSESQKLSKESSESKKLIKKSTNNSFYTHDIDSACSVALEQTNNNSGEGISGVYSSKCKDDFKLSNFLGKRERNINHNEKLSYSLSNENESSDVYSSKSLSHSFPITCQKIDAKQEEKQEEKQKEKILTKDEKEMNARLRFLERKKQKLNNTKFPS